MDGLLRIAACCVALVAASGCSWSISRRHDSQDFVEIRTRPGDEASLPASVAVIERPWSARGSWSSTDSQPQLRIGRVDGNHRAYLRAAAFDADSALGWPLPRDAGPIRVGFESDAATVTLTGDVEETSGNRFEAAGTASIRPNDAFVDTASDVAGGDRPSLEEVLIAAFDGLDLETLAAYGATGATIRLADVSRLASRGMEPDEIAALRDAGYDFAGDDLVRLASYGVLVDEAVRLRDAGYELDAKELTRLRSYRVDADYAIALRAAGYELDAKQLTRLRSYRVDADYAITLREAGQKLDAKQLTRLHSYRVRPALVTAVEEAGIDADVDDLVRLSSHGVQPELVRAFATSGLELTPANLVRLRSYGVDPELATAVAAPGGREDHEARDELRKWGIPARFVTDLTTAGYRFDVDDLILLRKWGVSTQYAIALRDELDELPSADRIVEFRKKGLSARDVRRLLHGDAPRDKADEEKKGDDARDAAGDPPDDGERDL